MKIKVTEYDIYRGCRKSKSDCPIALAVTRTYGEKFLVNGSTMYSMVLPESFNLPESAINFVRKFDAGEKVEPFEFEVEGL